MTALERVILCAYVAERLERYHAQEQSTALAMTYAKEIVRLIEAWVAPGEGRLKDWPTQGQIAMSEN